MIRLRKFVLYFLLALISFNLFEISKLYLQKEITKKTLTPYQVYHDPNKLINLSNIDNKEGIKETIIKLADEAGVNLIFTISKGNKFNYYWYIKEDKYLFPLHNLNHPIDLDKFNNLDEPITEKQSSKFNFMMPVKTYEYAIYPFIKISPDNLYGQLAIFSSREERINSVDCKINLNN